MSEFQHCCEWMEQQVKRNCDIILDLNHIPRPYQEKYNPFSKEPYKSEEEERMKSDREKGLRGGCYRALEVCPNCKETLVFVCPRCKSENIYFHEQKVMCFDCVDTFYEKHMDESIKTKFKIKEMERKNANNK